jgi:hypothetical protein
MVRHHRSHDQNRYGIIARLQKLVAKIRTPLGQRSSDGDEVADGHVISDGGLKSNAAMRRMKRPQVPFVENTGVCNADGCETDWPRR